LYKHTYGAGRRNGIEIVVGLDIYTILLLFQKWANDDPMIKNKDHFQDTKENPQVFRLKGFLCGGA